MLLSGRMRLNYLDCGHYESIDHYYCYNNCLFTRLISEIDRFGNVKCKVNLGNYSDKYIHSECIKLINDKLSKHFDTSLIYKNANTDELISFIFYNFMNKD